MKKEERELLVRLALEDVSRGYALQMKGELYDICHECGVDLENINDAYDLYTQTYAMKGDNTNVNFN